MAAQSPDTIAKLASWRARIRSGEALPVDELREALRLLRGDRAAAGAPTAGSKTTKARSTAAKKPSGDDLLSELEGL